MPPGIMDTQDRSEYRAVKPTFGRQTRRLGIVIGLPLVDGVFITLVLAGILDSLAGIVLAGLVIFGGTAAAAVVLTDTAHSPREQLVAIGVIGVVVIPLAGIQAMAAPSLALWLDVDLLKRFAVIILAIVALELADVPVRHYLPGPGPIVALALVVSLDPNNGIWAGADVSLFLFGSLAALIGIFAVTVMILVGNHLRHLLDPDRVGLAGSGALIVLAVSLMMPVPTSFALATLVVGLILSLERNPLGSSPDPLAMNRPQGPSGSGNRNR